MWLNLDLRTLYLSPKYFNEYKKIWGHLCNILFSFLIIWNSENIGRYVYLTFRFSSFFANSKFTGYRLCRRPLQQWMIRTFVLYVSGLRYLGTLRFRDVCPVFKKPCRWGKLCEGKTMKRVRVEYRRKRDVGGLMGGACTKRRYGGLWVKHFTNPGYYDNVCFPMFGKWKSSSMIAKATRMYVRCFQDAWFNILLLLEKPKTTSQSMIFQVTNKCLVYYSASVCFSIETENSLILIG